MTSGRLRTLGWDERLDALYAPFRGPESSPGRVLRHDGTAVLVGLTDDVRSLPIRRAVEPITVGDWVVVEADAVVDVVPRRSLLQRRDPSTGHGQLLAANVDVVVIVNGIDRPVRAGRLQRFVTLAWDAGATPLVALTKVDLDTVGSELEAAIADAVPNIDVVQLSVVTGAGLDELAARLAGQTAVFVGESGSGKSTLLNALAGEELAAGGAVRAGDHKGRHTTTARQLHTVPAGYCVIDSPGIREVGLWTDVETVDDVFDDIAELATGCRFRDCGHDGEPGCAVADALDTGALEPDRVVAWRRLRREAAAAELRADPYARRKADRAFCRMIKEVKRHHPPER